MLIKQNLSLLRVLRITWKTDIFLIVTCIAVYYLNDYVHEAIKIPATLATILGTALAFFVGFNNNQAYNRWWEARTIWGALVNDSRSWARQVIHFTEADSNPSALVSIRERMIRKHIGFVYALEESLRKKRNGYYKQFFSEEDLAKIKHETNVPNAILSLHADDLQKISKADMIDSFRFLEFNNLLVAFTDHMGKCERINNTIYPPSYIYFTKLFIWVLVVFMTMVLASTIGAWSILFGWIMGFVFHVTHINGMGLMNPFEETPNSIPILQISRTIEINLLQMLGAQNVPEPLKPIDNEYYL